MNTALLSGIRAGRDTLCGFDNAFMLRHSPVKIGALF
jgi:hypothetical protein